MSEITYLSDVVLSFPCLIEARASTEGSQAKFSGDFILAPNHPGFQQFMQRVAQVAQLKWDENAGPVLQMIQSDRKMRCYGSGQEKIDKKTFKPFTGYDGQMYISANNDIQPRMIQLDGSLADPANTMLCQALARKLYGGCHVNAAVKIWPQENKHGRGIRCELVAVQFFKDGTPFGDAIPDVTGMFGQVAAPAGNAASPAGAAVPQFPGFGFNAPAGGVPQFAPPPAFAAPAPQAPTFPQFQAPQAAPAPQFPAFQMPPFMGQ